MAKPQPFDPERFLSRLFAMDAVLVRAGFHAMSPWWRTNISRFVRALAVSKKGDTSATLRRWIVRAGRRSGKSSTLCRLAVAWAKWGPWTVPGGDVGIVSFVSVSRDEAAGRLRTIRDILLALHEPYEERSDEIELTGTRHVLFRLFSATVRGVVGHSSVLVLGDEVSRMESRDGLKNPAAEVFASLMPTLASMPYGFAVLSSSVLSENDYHAQLFDQGDTPHQLVSTGTTWECNPSITEADTHAMEPDPRIWSREYANEPAASISDALDRADILACFEDRPHKGMFGGGFVATDASSLVCVDAFTYVCGRQTDIGELVVREVGGWSGSVLRTMTLATAVKHIAERARTWNAKTIFGDQREAAGLISHFRAEGLHFKPYAWGDTSKVEAFQYLRRVSRERKLYLPEHAELKKELLSIKSRLMPSGNLRYETGGKDYASCLITLAHAALAKDMFLTKADLFVGGVGVGRGWGSTNGWGLGGRSVGGRRSW